MTNELEPTSARAGALYREVSAATKATLAELISCKRPIFAMPAWFVTTEAAEVAFMLSEAMRELTGQPEATYRTFFANSRHEALHGAIKLMRHAAIASFATHGGRVLILDGEDALRDTFDPLGEGPQRALVPGVDIVSTCDALFRNLESRRYCGVVLRNLDARDGSRDLANELVSYLEPHRRGGLNVAFDASDADFSSRASATGLEYLAAAITPDLIITGESLTDYEVPFGAFSGTNHIFEAWSHADTAFVHSTTYGGNTLALRIVAAHLAARWACAHSDARIQTARSRAASDWSAVLDLYERHVNPCTAKLHRSTCGLLHVVRAEGSRITVELDSGRRLDLLDGVCGGGLGVNGHNPDDARTEVLDKHDSLFDYVRQLEVKLAEETGLARFFPSVSGAGAVETALTLALLAKKKSGKRRIVVFQHNYGGKTLVSLLATAEPKTRSPFAPLYDDVRYIDPFADDACATLEAELATGSVALVWLELIHGSSNSFAALPESLLAVVARERESRGFLVGVDEILTSYYRCGDKFAFQSRLPVVDIVTLSKALSYMCFPIGATVVSEDVYRDACLQNERCTRELQSRYAHQLGAHFGLHSLAQAERLELASRTARLAARFRRDFDAIPAPSTSLGRRFCEGLFVRLEVTTPALPRALAKLGGETFMASVIAWWATSAGAFILYDCFGIPLVASENEVDELSRGIHALSRASPHRILLHGLAFFLVEKAARRWQSAARRTLRSARSLPIAARRAASRLFVDRYLRATEQTDT